MKNLFSNISVNKPKLNKFDLSHEKKMSITMGKMYPIVVQEILPGDKFKLKSEILLRLAPMISPVMHRINVYTHYFFVPNRLVWNEWEEFITGGEDGLQSPAYPKMNMSNTSEANWVAGRLGDYMGIPPTASIPSGENSFVSAMPFRAYQMIFDDYFRDQNLEAKTGFSIAGGNQAVSEQIILTEIRQRAWEKDYFTSALPWAQRGGDVELPIELDYKQITDVVKGDGTVPVDGNIQSLAGKADVIGTDSVRFENLEDNLNITINDLRVATQLQAWLEKSARGGSRYIEQIYSFFGVKSSDARLQRPEYLGGGKQPVIISEVLSTVGNTDPEFEPQGNMAGHGISVGRSNGFSKTFEEHGYVIGILSVLPRTAYQNGLERHFTKFDKFEYFWPEFAHLGEQEILNKEIFQDFTDEDANEGTFGYQQRYAEYKYQQSSVHGDFRTTLDFWHMGRIFSALPPLNDDFIHSDPTKRIFAVEDADADDIYVQIYNKVSALRPMPYHGIPSL